MNEIIEVLNTNMFNIFEYDEFSEFYYYKEEGNLKKRLL